MDDEYRELQEAARDALGDLLRCSEPGTGMSLHYAYADLQRSLRSAADEQRVTGQNERIEAFQRRTAWKRTPRAERHHRVLNALGDDHVTTRELLERLRSAHPECDVYESHLRAVLADLLRLGEVSRTSEPRSVNTTAYRWRWSRRARLSGEIQALQRALAESDD